MKSIVKLVLVSILFGAHLYLNCVLWSFWVFFTPAIMGLMLLQTFGSLLVYNVLIISYLSKFRIQKPTLKQKLKTVKYYLSSPFAKFGYALIFLAVVLPPLVGIFRMYDVILFRIMIGMSLVIVFSASTYLFQGEHRARALRRAFSPFIEEVVKDRALSRFEVREFITQLCFLRFTLAKYEKKIHTLKQERVVSFLSTLHNSYNLVLETPEKQYLYSILFGQVRGAYASSIQAIVKNINTLCGITNFYSEYLCYESCKLYKEIFCYLQAPLPHYHNDLQFPLLEVLK